MMPLRGTLMNRSNENKVNNNKVKNSNKNINTVGQTVSNVGNREEFHSRFVSEIAFKFEIGPSFSVTVVPGVKDYSVEEIASALHGTNFNKENYNTGNSIARSRLNAVDIDTIKRNYQQVPQQEWWIFTEVKQGTVSEKRSLGESSKRSTTTTSVFLQSLGDEGHKLIDTCLLTSITISDDGSIEFSPPVFNWKLDKNIRNNEFFTKCFPSGSLLVSSPTSSAPVTCTVIPVLRSAQTDQQGSDETALEVLLERVCLEMATCLSKELDGLSNRLAAAGISNRNRDYENTWSLFVDVKNIHLSTMGNNNKSINNNNINSVAFAGQRPWLPFGEKRLLISYFVSTPKKSVDSFILKTDSGDSFYGKFKKTNLGYRDVHLSGASGDKVLMFQAKNLLTSEKMNMPQRLCSSSLFGKVDDVVVIEENFHVVVDVKPKLDEKKTQPPASETEDKIDFDVNDNDDDVVVGLFHPPSVSLFFEAKTVDYWGREELIGYGCQNININDKKINNNIPLLIPQNLKMGFLDNISGKFQNLQAPTLLMFNLDGELRTGKTSNNNNNVDADVVDVVGESEVPEDSVANLTDSGYVLNLDVQTIVGKHAGC